MEDLHINSFIQILDITVNDDSLSVKSPSSIEYKLGRSIHFQYIDSIPFIINEEKQKLFESILIVDSFGRFINSNPPP